MTKPTVDLTFLKYKSSIQEPDVFDNFLSLGFKQANESVEDVSSWWTAGGVILHVKSVFNSPSGIYGLGFYSNEPDGFQEIEDPNGFSLTVAGEHAMESYLDDSFDRRNTQRDPSELLNFYGLVYNTNNLKNTIDFYMANWDWKILEDEEDYILLTSSNNRSVIKFVEAEKNAIQTAYVGVKDIKVLRSKLSFEDYNIVDPGRSKLNNYKLPAGFSESIINNYNLSIGGRNQNFAIEFCTKNALPNLDLIFSQRFAFNTLSQTNYEKFYKTAESDLL
tara:strand:- start:14759 stop:15589 length:831 start_codon:yes stop_codon:yes gene_type:complete